MKNPVSITRGDLLVIGLVVSVISGVMLYEKVYADGSTSNVKVTPVEMTDKVEPVYSEILFEFTPEVAVKKEGIDDEEDTPSFFQQLKDKLFGSEPKPDPKEGVGLKSEGQKIPTDTSKKLKQQFDAETEKNTQRIVKDAKFDAEEVKCHVRNIVFEAGGESILGQKWVFDVVRNRTLMEYRGNKTVCDTVFDPRQFSWANYNPNRVPMHTRDLEVAEELVNDMYFDPDHRDITCGATHYLKKDIMWDVRWSREALQGKSSEGLVLKAVIGAHAFFGKEGCNVR